MRTLGGNGASFHALHPGDRLRWKILTKILIISRNTELKKCLSFPSDKRTLWHGMTVFNKNALCLRRVWCKRMIKKRPVMNTKLCLLFKSGRVRARLKNGPIGRRANVLWNYFKSCRFQRMPRNLHWWRISLMIGALCGFHTIKRQMAAFQMKVCVYFSKACVIWWWESPVKTLSQGLQLFCCQTHSCIQCAFMIYNSSWDLVYVFL